MNKLTLTSANRHEVLAAAVRSLEKENGVIAAPTETVYGLMTLWTHHAGRKRIFELKQRPAEKHLQMLAADLQTAADFGVQLNPLLQELAARFWPGPLTVVCSGNAGNTVGLRIPDHFLLRDLLQALQEPLAATSANRSGEPAAAQADGAVANLKGKPDLLIDGGRVGGTASTVISIVGKHVEILREGSIQKNQLCDFMLE